MSASKAAPEALLHRLEWTVLRRLDGLLHGDYRTLFRGQGVDLAELREYQHSDDVRHIDWNVTARLQTPHVRVYNEERETAAWFLVDTTQSLDFGSQTVRKRMVATELVGVLARLFSRHGNRVGAAFYGGTLDTVIPARSGRRHVLHILNSMMTRPAPKPGETRLSDLVTAAMHAIPRRSVVFIISDFISAPGWERPLAQVAERHETLAVRLFDPLEQQLPDLGIVTMQDAESGEQLVVDTHDRAFRRRFAEAALRREEALRQSFAQAGVDVLELSTDDDLMDAVMRFADLRRQRSRMAAGAPLSRYRGT
ncbi:DUF58 domain-containing protein [Noviherbaspirillum pedocola]|uniref:DUF58 domain-containing protein n=1 Tax=Noviherbaspirillum pedocola TaxID=2801341 RepID=A0A934VZL4_9BURK|nr:DUF58 domain-containing protein [Noviherbaspirillum pedocola]MBK4733136.1 DUF58 domain-containing protein [Noviherbaspirillum pedocola]